MSVLCSMFWAYIREPQRGQLGSISSGISAAAAGSSAKRCASRADDRLHRPTQTFIPRLLSRSCDALHHHQWEFCVGVIRHGFSLAIVDQQKNTEFRRVGSGSNRSSYNLPCQPAGVSIFEARSLVVDAFIVSFCRAFLCAETWRATAGSSARKLDEAGIKRSDPDGQPM